MSDLPEGWSISTIAALIGADGLFADGDWVESKDQDPNGSIRLLQLADIGDGKFADKSSRFINEHKFVQLRCSEVLENDVLIARMPDPLGRACLAPKLKQRCITVVDVAILRPGKSSVSPSWLMHFINSPDIRQHVELEATGSTRKRIARGKLAEMELPIPPLAEQERIAEKLEEILQRVDVCRTRLNCVPPLLKRFRQSILAAATSGRLTAEWRTERHDGAWRPKKLTELGEFGRGKSKHRPRNDPRLYGGQYPFIQTGDIANSGGRIVRHSQTYTEFGLAQSKLWPAGTVCITIAANIADTAILSYPACFPDSVVGFVANPKECCPEFVKWAVDVIRNDLEALAPATAQKNINLGVLAEVEISCPPLPEQKEIVRRVEALFAFADRIEARLATAQKTVERLTPAVLAKAFRGELVPQNPNDEPASALLARLRSSQSKLPTTPRIFRVLEDSNVPDRLRTLKQNAVMTKSRFDEDVKGQPYLANLLRNAPKAQTAEDLFKISELPLVDFYKQLAWEVDRGMIRDEKSKLEAVG